EIPDRDLKPLPRIAQRHDQLVTGIHEESIGIGRYKRAERARGGGREWGPMPLDESKVHVWGADRAQAGRVVVPTRVRVILKRVDVQRRGPLRRAVAKEPGRRVELHLHECRAGVPTDVVGPGRIWAVIDVAVAIGLARNVRPGAG